MESPVTETEAIHQNVESEMEVSNHDPQKEVEVSENLVQPPNVLKTSDIEEENVTNEVEAPSQTNETSGLPKTGTMELNSEDVQVNSDFSFPEFQFDNPLQVASVEHPPDETQPYIRGCKWSPDGTCLLYAVRGQGMSVVELPVDLYGAKHVEKDREISNLKPAVSIPENAQLYDFCWYPGMKSQDPATCCWLTTCQHGPVQLWDAFTGQLRCTYRGYDAVDEVEAAYSLQFSHDASRIYCGYRKSIKIFDADKPGREYSSYPMNDFVSCIATNWVQPGQFASGSWSKVIQLLDDRGDSAQMTKRITGHFGGVTHLKFSPDGTCLYSGARKDNELICWDLRALGRPLYIFNRKVENQQRIYFDISPCGSYIFSGGTDSFVKAWNLLTGDKETLSLHKDSVNSVSIHPYLPILATGSGQHHYFRRYYEEIADTRPIDNSIKVWWLGK